MKVTIAFSPLRLAALAVFASISSWAADSVPPAGSTPGSAAGAGAKIQFSEPIFDFGKLKAGARVKHEFEFSNVGDAVLEITDVKVSCGCTTAGQWERRIEPGKTGVIPIEFRAGSSDGPVQKSIYVTSNDRSNPRVTLGIKGTLWKPISVQPRSAYFTVSSDTRTSTTKTLLIKSDLPEPVTLSEPQSSNPSFRADLETVTPGKEFALKVTAVPPFQGRYANSRITIQTSARELPTLLIGATAIVRDPVMLSPTQVTLPPGRLARVSRPTLTVRNNTSAPISVSGAEINLPNVEVNVREVQPGKLFYLTAVFPVGFELPPGTKAEVTVRTSHPDYPVLKAPVVQRTTVARAPASRSAIRGPSSLPSQPATLPGDLP